MHQTSLRLTLSMLLLAGCLTPCLARVVPHWDYEKLVAEADLVAVVDRVGRQLDAAIDAFEREQGIDDASMYAEAQAVAGDREHRP